MSSALNKHSGNGNSALITAASANDATSLIPRAVERPIAQLQRTSSLPAPILRYSGHSAEVNAVCFSTNDGTMIASAASDRTILLWDLAGCNIQSLLSGHKEAILDICWTMHNESIVSASADKSLGLWDIATGEKTRAFRSHRATINSCDVKSAHLTAPLILSGSNDNSIKLWDARSKEPVSTMEHICPVTTVTFARGSTVDPTSNLIYSAGLDNCITIRDLRADGQVIGQIVGHTDTITGISCSPDGIKLVSAAMDNTVRVWDCLSGSCEAVLSGAILGGFAKNLYRPAWSADGSHVGCGSADRTVLVWDISQPTEIKYKLPGHTGSVNDVDFHPIEPIIVSGSSDTTLYLGELAL